MLTVEVGVAVEYVTETVETARFTACEGVQRRLELGDALFRCGVLFFETGNHRIRFARFFFEPGEEVAIFVGVVAPFGVFGKVIKHRAQEAKVRFDPASADFVEQETERVQYRGKRLVFVFDEPPRAMKALCSVGVVNTDHN